MDCLVSLVHDADAVQMDESVVAALDRAAAQSRPLLARLLNPQPHPAVTPPADQAADERHDPSVLQLDGTLADDLGDSGMGICANNGGNNGVSSRDCGSKDSGGSKDSSNQCAAQPGIPAALFTEDSSSSLKAGSSKHADAGARGPRVSHEQGTDAASKAAAPAAELTEVPPLRFVSGAGHDAMALAGKMPAGMLFVRCRNGGISHSPQELVDDEDVAASTAALLAYLLEESS